jgi:Zn-dependent M28 family amino/carboxypeptidase
VLEIARAFGASKIQPVNRVIFAFWSGGADGQVGSARYLADLSAEARANISVVLNYNSLASRNYIYGMYLFPIDK